MSSALTLAPSGHLELCGVEQHVVRVVGVGRVQQRALVEEEDGRGEDGQRLERVEAEHAVPQQEGLLGGEVASEREGDPRRGEAHGLEAETLWRSKLVGELVGRVSEREGDTFPHASYAPASLPSY